MNGSLQSNVHIAFRYDAQRQQTVLSRRKAGGLCHLSKAYWDGQVLGLQLVNPTAGLFSGDALHLQVDIGQQSQVALTSPSASRYHTMPEGRAHLTQRFEVGENGWLDFWPEIVIPQHDSDVCQSTEVDLHPGASMLFLDLAAPGRVAHGERYQFRRLETRLAIRQDGQLLAKERCILEPVQSIWPLEVPGWELCYYGALWIAGPQAVQAIPHLQEARFGPEATCRHGASLVADQLGVLRIVANSSLALRKAADQARQHLQHQEPRLTSHFRKL